MSDEKMGLNRNAARMTHRPSCVKLEAKAEHSKNKLIAASPTLGDEFCPRHCTWSTSWFCTCRHHRISDRSRQHLFVVHNSHVRHNRRKDPALRPCHRTRDSKRSAHAHCLTQYPSCSSNCPCSRKKRKHQKKTEKIFASLDLSLHALWPARPLSPRGDRKRNKAFKKMVWWKILLVALVVAVLLAGVGLGVFYGVFNCAWSVSAWGPCQNGQQSRTATCACRSCRGARPELVQACGPENPEGPRFIDPACKGKPWSRLPVAQQARTSNDQPFLPALSAAPEEPGFLNFINDSGAAVRVWLDQKYPPCQPNAPDCSWENTGVTECWIRSGDDKRPVAMASSQVLEPGETWSIRLPVRTQGTGSGCPNAQGCPVWCTGATCPGSGGWVTRANVNMDAPGKVTRFEFNVNAPALWANLSAVDGANTNLVLQYTSSPACPENHTEFLVPLNECPWPAEEAGAAVCAAPKYEPGCSQKDCVEINGEVRTECQWAGCGYGSEPTKCRCHQFWARSPNAVRWNDYIRHYPGAPSSCYSWAYSEKTLVDPKAEDCCLGVKDCCEYPDMKDSACCRDPTNEAKYNCCQRDACLKDTPRGPLVVCPLQPNKIGSLNIWIKYIL